MVNINQIFNEKYTYFLVLKIFREKSDVVSHVH